MATIVLLRFDESTTDFSATDSAGKLADLADAGSTATAIVDGFAGYARRFASGATMQAADVVAGSTLTSRDLTIDAILRWDFDGQVTYNTAAAVAAGLVCARGIGAVSPTPAEYTAYALELRVVNAALRIGELRLAWNDSAGGSHNAPGGQFVMPAASANGFALFTAVRHWVSPTVVQVTYYVGDTLVGDHLISDGDIGGGATGTFAVGGAVLIGLTNVGYFIGDIDELRVRNEAVSAEEVAATYARIALWQPRGYSMVRQLMPPQEPMSDDPASRVQRLYRGWGHALGYAMGQVDNMLNLMPDRAFGPVLTRWERITRKPSRPGDSIAQRRARVGSRFAQRMGSSPPGMAAATADLQQVGRDQLQILAFSNDVNDDLSVSPSLSRWWFPLGLTDPGVSWSGSSDKALRFHTTGSIDLPCRTLTDGRVITALMSAQGGGKRQRLIATLTENAALPAGAEVGICYVNWLTNSFLLYGLRNRAGTRYLSCELRVAGVQVALTEIASPIAAMTPVVLYLHHTSTPGTFRFDWAASPLSSSTVFTSTTFVAPGFTRFDWAGGYARTLNGAAAAFDAKLQDFRMRSSYGDRPFQFYVYRDPLIPGLPDMQAAQQAASSLAQMHTRVGVITNKTALCDSGTVGTTTTSLCDSTPMGAL